MLRVSKVQSVCGNPAGCRSQGKTVHLAFFGMVPACQAKDTECKYHHVLKTYDDGRELTPIKRVGQSQAQTVEAKG